MRRSSQPAIGRCRPGRRSRSGAGPSEQVKVTSEDAATILVRFADGARGSVVVSQVSHGHKNDLRLDVAGAEGSLMWRQEDPERLWIGGLDESRLLHRAPATGGDATGIPSLPAGHPEGWTEALRDLLRPFYASILSGAAPPAPGEAGRLPDPRRRRAGHRLHRCGPGIGCCGTLDPVPDPIEALEKTPA